MPHITAEFANNHDLASRPVPAASWRSTSCHRPPWPIGLFCHRGKTHYALQNQSPTYAAQIFGRFQFPTPIPSYTLHRIAAGGALQAVVLQSAKPCFHPKDFFWASEPSPPRVAFLQLKICGRKKRKQTSVGGSWPKEFFNAVVTLTPAMLCSLHTLALTHFTILLPH